MLICIIVITLYTENLMFTFLDYQYKNRRCWWLDCPWDSHPPNYSKNLNFYRSHYCLQQWTRVHTLTEAVKGPEMQIVKLYIKRNNQPHQMQKCKFVKNMIIYVLTMYFKILFLVILLVKTKILSENNCWIDVNQSLMTFKWGW